MFGSKKETSANDKTFQSDTDREVMPKGYTPKKGTPTPKRKEVEAANRRPIVADRTKLSREAKKAQRAENRRRSNELYYKQQQAMRTGDEANMPAQHRGKLRKWARDYVDASGPISGWFMPIAIALIPLMVVQMRFPQIVNFVAIALYVVFFAMLIHAVIIVRRAKLLAGHRYGFDQIPRGFTMQMLGRAFYIRRWRLPAAQVKRGEFPPGSSKEDLKEAKKATKA
ncbi:DUF3043 domain-containing protein [Arcanobacterium bovis]|uniref:DUF3043 domain-containing protein n=1 Tax=Arcanobacterium bovis TaxID=2529275 RepID=A0A4Q9V154_9ACTO|nr:DUF3043 domain-containing protein [Arcanobacterium bovis]TBW22824.1 DUF3043 domain-containing protein [Arcanobacterium bovis]